MKLLTKELKDKLPALYSQEEVEDPIVYVKYFHPFSSWYWFGLEFDGEDTFFGYVVGHENEYGYFSLSELESIKIMGLGIERDLHFTPTPISKVKERYDR